MVAEHPSPGHPTLPRGSGDRRQAQEHGKYTSTTYGGTRGQVIRWDLKTPQQPPRDDGIGKQGEGENWCLKRP